MGDHIELEKIRIMDKLQNLNQIRYVHFSSCATDTPGTGGTGWRTWCRVVHPEQSAQLNVDGDFTHPIYASLDHPLFCLVGVAQLK